MKKLYVCEWNSNGTNDLLVVADGDILECIPEALFGVRVDAYLNADLELSRVFDDFIGPYSNESEEYDDDYHPVCREISLGSVLKWVAVSPTQTEEEAISAIKEAIGASSFAEMKKEESSGGFGFGIGGYNHG